MQEQPGVFTILLDDIRTILAWLAVTLTGVVMWIGRRQITRIDDVETAVAKCMTRDEVERLVGRLEIKITEASARTDARLDTLLQHLMSRRSGDE